MRNDYSDSCYNTLNCKGNRKKRESISLHKLLLGLMPSIRFFVYLIFFMCSFTLFVSIVYASEVTKTADTMVEPEGIARFELFFNTTAGSDVYFEEVLPSGFGIVDWMVIVGSTSYPEIRYDLNGNRVISIFKAPADEFKIAYSIKFGSQSTGMNALSTTYRLPDSRGTLESKTVVFDRPIEQMSDEIKQFLTESTKKDDSTLDSYSNSQSSVLTSLPAEVENNIPLSQIPKEPSNAVKSSSFGTSKSDGNFSNNDSQEGEYSMVFWAALTVMIVALVILIILFFRTKRKNDPFNFGGGNF